MGCCIQNTLAGSDARARLTGVGQPGRSRLRRPGAFNVAAPDFAAAFVVHGLHGVLPPFLHNPAQSRAAFLAAATATSRQALGAGAA